MFGAANRCIFNLLIFVLLGAFSECGWNRATVKPTYSYPLFWVSSHTLTQHVCHVYVNQHSRKVIFHWCLVAFSNAYGYTGYPYLPISIPKRCFGLR